MAEPASQVVAYMPRARFLGLMALFLGPAVAVYTALSIYPLLATMALATYTTDQSGAYHFVGFANFTTLFTDTDWSTPFWNARCATTSCSSPSTWRCRIRSASRWRACSACPA